MMVWSQNMDLHINVQYIYSCIYPCTNPLGDEN